MQAANMPNFGADAKALSLRNPPHHYRGWLVVLGCFLCCTIYGTFYAFGIFFRPLQTEFGWSSALTSSVQSIHLLTYIFSSFIVGWATDRFGPRRPLILCALCVGGGYLLCSRINAISHLYLYYTITSLGAGLVWSLPLSTVQRWFFEKRGLALGITVSGIGIGTLVWAPIANHVIYSYGWRSAYAVMGMASLAILMLSALLVGGGLRPAVATSGREQVEPYAGRVADPATGIQSMPVTTAMKSRALWLICTFQFFFNVGMFLIFVHLVPFAIQQGFETRNSALAVGTIGGVSVLGRVISPLLVESRMGARWERGLVVCAVCNAFMLLWLNQVHTIGMLGVFVVVVGYLYGSWIPLVVAMTGSVFGLKHLGTLLGVTQIGLVGGILGPLLGGFIHDKTGSYSIAFGLCSLSFLCAAIVAAVISVSIDRQTIERLMPEGRQASG